MNSRRKVTIIIPVYGDWTSLQACIVSVKKFVDTTIHKVVLVNDCGPEADEIEVNIKKEIKDSKGFYYYRNEKNLGFLKNCNHAVFDLDKTNNDILLLNSDTEVTEGFLEELMSVLYVSEHHGAVSPRSNHATLASIPVRIDDSKQYSASYSKKVHSAVKDLLPSQTDIPVAHGFCMLIRRDLIQKYGLFDEIYGKGYCEEADFCMRLRLHGYKSLLANWSFVFHARSRSFGEEERKVFIQQNEKILYERYPDLPELYRQYVTKYIDAVDWFSERFIEGNRKKILLDVSHLQAHHEAIVEQAMEMLAVASKRKEEDVEYIIAAHRDVYEKYNLAQFNLRTIFYGETNETFDLGVAFGGVVFPNNLTLLNRHCVKFTIVGLQTLEYFIPLSDQAEQSMFHDTYRSATRLAEVSLAGKQTELNVLEDKAKQPIIATTALRSRWEEIVSREYLPRHEKIVKSKQSRIIDKLKQVLS